MALFRNWQAWSRSLRPRKSKTRRPLASAWRNRLHFETLEHRQLLSVTPAGTEQQINTQIAGDQQRPSVAVDASGNYVVVWESFESSSFEVKGQRFAATGTPLGSEFRINTYTTGNQQTPSVSAAADGSFVAIWSSPQDGASYGIYAQRYDTAGAALGSEFRINTYTTGDQRSPVIALETNGDFVTAWASYGQDGSGGGIYAKRFDAAGTLLGSEFRVNAYTTGNQTDPSITSDEQGEFIIAWESTLQDGDADGIYAALYNFSGVIQGSAFLVNNYTTGSQSNPAVASDSTGDFTIAWQQTLSGGDADIYARRFYGSGSPIASQFRVNTYTTGDQTSPTTAVDADGDVVIAWESSAQDGSNLGLFAQRYDSIGWPQATEFPVNTYTTGSQSLPSLAIAPVGDFVVAWNSDQQDGSGNGTFAQRFQITTRVQEVRTTGARTVVDEAERLVSTLAAGPSLQVTFSHAMSQIGGASGSASVTNPANWTLTKNGSDITSQISAISFSGLVATLSFSSELAAGDYQLTAHDALQDSDGRPLDGDSDGTLGGNFVRNFDILPPASSGSEVRVNTFTPGNQYAGGAADSQQAVAVDDVGNYVIVWTSEFADGNGEGVFARRYNALGMAQGSDFRVNTTTSLNQRWATVAMDIDGDFVVTWSSQSQDGSGYGIYGQRFNAQAVPQGSEFRVNTYTTSTQSYASVAMDALGNFTVVWVSTGQDAGSDGVYAQRFSSTGATLGSEFRIVSQSTNPQFAPSISMGGDGKFVVTYTTNAQDGLNNDGIFVRRYAANGSQVGNVARVHTYITGAQRQSASAVSATGDFIVTWASALQDGSDYGVYAQRFDSAGAMLGSEFRVNTYTTGLQSHPAVAVDSDGDFIIAWESNAQDGSSTGVYAQRFTAAGVKQGSEFRLNSYTTGQQSGTSVAMDRDGDFIIVWSDSGQGSSDVYSKHFFVPPSQVSEVRLTGYPTAIAESERLVATIAAGESLQVTFTQPMSQLGGVTGLNSVSNPANWRLTKNGLELSSQIASVSYTGVVATLTLANSLTPGSYVLTARDFIADANGDLHGGVPLDGDANGVPGGDFKRTFKIAPAGAIGSEFRVNTYITGDQRTPLGMAMSAAGNYIIAWQSEDQDGSGWGIYAQRYNASGTPQGSEFRVNTYTTDSQYFPAVAMDPAGDFVITWTSLGQDGFTSGSYAYGNRSSVYAQRYNASGVPQGSEFLVNTYTSWQQYGSSVAMDQDGDFVISWTSAGQDSNGYVNSSGESVFAQRYNAAGVLQGSEFRVNTYTRQQQSEPLVAMESNGDFLIAWTSDGQDGSSEGVFAQRFNANGTMAGSEFRINTTTGGSQRGTGLAMGPDGNLVAVWQSFTQDGSGQGVYAQRFDNNGAPLGSEFRVNTYTTNAQEYSAIAANSRGDFIITWSSYFQVAGSGYDVYAQRFNALGVPQGSEFRINSYTGNQQAEASVVMDSDGDFVVAWIGAFNDVDGPILSNGIYARRFGALTHVDDVRITGASSPVLAGERLVSSIPAGASLKVSFNQAVAQTGGSFGPTSVTNPANWGLTKDGVDISNQIASVSYTGTTATLTLSSALTTGRFALTARQSILDTSGTAIDGDENQIAGGNFTRTFEIEPAVAIGSHFLVNTYTTGTQGGLQRQAIAADVVGNYVVTWPSQGQDGSGHGIYAQRYNSLSVPQGSEFRVNTYTTDAQTTPSVAMAPDGDFVITWVSRGQDGSDAGVFAQRFSADGSPQGSEFQVNTYTTSDQSLPSVAMAADGSFAITWSQDTWIVGEGVFAQRFDATGTRLGSEFNVSSSTSLNQSDSQIAMANDGSFVVAWRDYFRNDDGDSIYARRFDARGVPLGSDFHVNTYTTNDQHSVSLAMSPGGDFVMTWSSYGQDGDSDGIYAQRYNSSGVPQGSEFLVNTYRLAAESQSSVAMDADGDFIVTWQSDYRYDNDPAIVAQRYSSTGEKQGSEFRITGVRTSYQLTPSVATSAAGDFVVVWCDMAVDGSSPGIFGQRFAQPTTRVNEVRVAGSPTAIVEGERLLSGIAAGASLQVRFHRAVSQTGGTSGVASVTNRANWLLTQNGVDITSQIISIAYSDGLATLTIATPLNDGEYVLTAREAIKDLDGLLLDGDANDLPGGDFRRGFEIWPPVAVGSEFRVNTYTTGNQTGYHNNSRTMAMDDAGNFVVVWSSFGQDGSGYGVYAQRFAASGAPQGSEFRVNTYTTGNQRYPSIARAADGYFVVVWSSQGQDGSDDGIYAQRFSANGIKFGSEFRVNTTTTLSQSFPVIAVDDSHNLVVAWTSTDQDGSGQGIYAQRYDVTNRLKGSEFQINSITLGDQVANSIAMDVDGNFVVTWTDSLNDGSQEGVYARAFDLVGIPLGTEFRVNTYTTGKQQYSMASRDADGNFVVVWSTGNNSGVGDEVHAQRFDASGTPLGSEFRVNNPTAAFHHSAAVDMDSDGDFVVSWVTDDGSFTGVRARRYDAQGTPLDTEFLVNSTTLDAQAFSAVALDRDGDFVVSWVSSNQDGSTTGLYAQRFYAPTTRVGEVRVVGALGPVVENDRLITVIPDGANLQATFTHAMSQVGAAAGSTSVTNPANWQLTKNGVDISSQITGVNYSGLVAQLTLSSILTDGDYVLTIKASIQDSHSALLDGDGNGSPGGDFVRTFKIARPVPVGSEFRINTYTTSQQQTQFPNPQSVARDAAGNFVAVWHSVQDGLSLDIFAQRFDALGNPLGSEFRVNTYTTNAQRNAAVAMDSDGDFVVTWTSFLQDASNDGVYAQRFNSAGVPQGPEFRVNVALSGAQNFSTVAMDSNGNFAIAWMSDTPSSVYVRKYNAAGVAQTSEVAVNTYTTGVQLHAKVAMDRDGDFVVTWSSQNQDGNEYGVYGKRFNAAAVAQGSEFRINTTTAFTQTFASPTMSPLGDFVVTWSSEAQDASNYGIYAQRYNALGVPQGSEFRVNSYTTGGQRWSAAAMDAHGDFVIVWTSEHNQDGSGGGIYAQRYRATGAAVGSEFRINTTTQNDQQYPWISMDADGDFVVAWVSSGQDGSFDGMYGQRFAAATPLQINAVTPTATGVEIEINHPIDTSVLNLYDQNGVFGAADITLVGETTGEVRGSLVVAPGATKVTFIKSGGPLAAEKYTVTLQSGASGFKRDTGELLDGNGDQSSGDNYSGNFTIAAPAPTAITLSVPDFTRGFGQAVNLPGSSGLPISISNALGVKSATFTLNYNPALLSITGAAVGAGITGSVTLDTSVPGIAQISVTSATGLSSTAGLQTLVNLTASVPNDAPYSQKHRLDLSNLQILDTSPVPMALPAIDNDGLHIAAYFGDANGSQSYNAPDATFAQQIIVGSYSGLQAYQLADPYLVIDISGNSQVQSNDVTLIQRAIVGLFTPEIPSIPSLSPAATGGPDPIVSISQNLTASVGDTIAVPVELLVTEPTGITLAGADIAIAYDASTLELAGAGVGQLLIGFGLSVNTSTPGLIRLTLGGSPLDLDYSTSGVLATLQFTVLAGAGTTSSINLLQTSASLQTALYDAAGGPLTLSPAPTDANDDIVDGLLTIEPSPWSNAIDAAFANEEFVSDAG